MFYIISKKIYFSIVKYENVYLSKLCKVIIPYFVKYVAQLPAAYAHARRNTCCSTAGRITVRLWMFTRSVA